MAKTKISEFSATANSNTDINSINIAEGCAPSNINDAIRELMAELKDFQAGTKGDSFNGPVGTTTAAAGAFTTLSASSTVSGTGFSTYLASPPAIGGTAAAAGSFTTLTTSSTVTLNGGTANGVLYLNGSKVATSGSALTFDGTLLTSSTSQNTGTYIKVQNSNAGASAQAFYQISNGTNTASFGLFGSSFTTSGVFRQDGAYVYSGSAAGGLTLDTGADVPIYFGINNSEAMRLTSTGLGIGTSNPLVKLVVSNAGAEGLEVNPSGGTVRLTAYNRSGGAYAPLAFTGTSGISLTLGSTGIDFNSQMLLNTSGNLGLGVTPSAWSTLKGFDIGSNGSLASHASGSTDSAFVSGNAYFNGTNWIYKGTSTATQYKMYGGVHSWHTAASGTAGNAITFTQALTLNSSGNLLLGQTAGVGANGGRMEIYAADNYNGAPNLALNVGANNTGGIYLYFTNAAGTKIGSVTQASSTSVAYNTTSDYRLKNITGPITTSGLYIDSLNPVEGNWKDDGSTFVGLIAHEVQEVSRTQIATGTKDGAEMQSMDYSASELIANLIAEVKSLRQRVAALESK